MKSLYEIFVDKVKDDLKDYTDVVDDIYEHDLSNVFFRYKDNEILVDSGAFDRDESASGIPVVRLDDAVDDKVTFIKYDLEGADIPSIKRAEKTIRTYKPKVALSIYHNIEDLWEIPLLVKEYVSEYKLFIKYHTRYLWDKIMYAAI